MDSFKQQKLVRLVRKLSYREGDYTLSSGQKSNFYIDLKNTTLHPEGAVLIGELSVEILLSAFDVFSKKMLGVGGLTLGADPIATAVSICAWGKGYLWPAFIVRKESKKHGTQQYIEGIENLKSVEGVVVLEDVVTTGGSSIKAIERIRDAGLRVLAVITVVDREQGGANAFASLGVPFYSLCRISEIIELK